MTERNLLACPARTLAPPGMDPPEHLWIQRGAMFPKHCQSCGIDFDTWCRQTEALVGPKIPLRDYFAAHCAWKPTSLPSGDLCEAAKAQAQLSYIFADAMLAERSK